MDLVGAEGADDEHPSRAERPHHEPEQVASRTVGPVQVFQDEHDGAFCGRPFQQDRHHLEQPPPRIVGRPRGRAELGQQPGQRPSSRSGVLQGEFDAKVTHEVAHGTDDRAEGKAVAADLDALADDDEGTGIGGLGGELTAEGGLADARLAAQQHCHRLTATRRGQGRAEFAELADTAHDARAGRR